MRRPTSSSVVNEAKSRHNQVYRLSAQQGVIAIAYMDDFQTRSSGRASFVFTVASVDSNMMVGIDTSCLSSARNEKRRFPAYACQRCRFIPIVLSAEKFRHSNARLQSRLSDDQKTDMKELEQTKWSTRTRRRKSRRTRKKFLVNGRRPGHWVCATPGFVPASRLRVVVLRE